MCCGRGTSPVLTSPRVEPPESCASSSTATARHCWTCRTAEAMPWRSAGAPSVTPPTPEDELASTKPPPSRPAATPRTALSTATYRGVFARNLPPLDPEPLGPRRSTSASRPSTTSSATSKRPDGRVGPFTKVLAFRWSFDDKDISANIALDVEGGAGGNGRIVLDHRAGPRAVADRDTSTSTVPVRSTSRHGRKTSSPLRAMSARRVVPGAASHYAAAGTSSH